MAEQEPDFPDCLLPLCSACVPAPSLPRFSAGSRPGTPRSLRCPHNFNMAAVGVMKKGMSMSLFSSP
ncbi:hypothetical protein PDN83_27935, partial [Escherichia coli]|nr:hypothetical protein [Escherichia coli]